MYNPRIHGLAPAPQRPEFTYSAYQISSNAKASGSIEAFQPPDPPTYSLCVDNIPVATPFKILIGARNALSRRLTFTLVMPLLGLFRGRIVLDRVLRCHQPRPREVRGTLRSTSTTAAASSLTGRRYIACSRYAFANTPVRAYSSRSSSTMKEAVVGKGTLVEIIDSPVPSPGPDQVVTKVVVSGANPKDWKVMTCVNTTCRKLATTSDCHCTARRDQPQRRQSGR